MLVKINLNKICVMICHAPKSFTDPCTFDANALPLHYPLVLNRSTKMKNYD